ncbi:MAG: HlyD family efflux transporter periplasmic adaptor subunit [Planctomycetes bacterium]|nr:HlyD family efflux transporter periplasmic adaptor subunit [Planctomycetota bacterium]
MSKLMKLMIMLVIVIGVVYFVYPFFVKVQVGAAAVIAPNADAQEVTKDQLGSRRSNQEAFTAKVEATSPASLTCFTSGIITEVRAVEGAPVKVGDVLFVFDSAEADMAVTSAEVALRERNAGHQLALLKNATDLRTAGERVTDAKAGLADAEARLKASEEDRDATIRRSEDEIVRSRLEKDRSEVRLERSLRKYNQGLKLAGLAEIAFKSDGNMKLAKRPAAKDFDDTVMSYDEFVEAELAFREAQVAHVQALIRVTSAEVALKDAKFQKDVAVDTAKRALDAAKNSLASAEANLAETTTRVAQDEERSEAGVAAAQQRLNEAMMRQERMSVKADVEGYIAGIFVERNRAVSSGTKLATIVAASELQAQIWVPTSWLGDLKQGKVTVMAMVPTLLDKDGVPLAVNAHIESVTDVLNENALGHRVVFKLSSSGENADALRHGMQIRLTLTRQS